MNLKEKKIPFSFMKKSFFSLVLFMFISLACSLFVFVFLKKERNFSFHHKELQTGFQKTTENFKSSKPLPLHLRTTEKLSAALRVSIQALSSSTSDLGLKTITLRGRAWGFSHSSQENFDFEWILPKNMEMLSGNQKGESPSKERDFERSTEIVLRETDSSSSSPQIFLFTTFLGFTQIAQYDLNHQEEIDQVVQSLNQRKKEYEKGLSSEVLHQLNQKGQRIVLQKVDSRP